MGQDVTKSWLYWSRVYRHFAKDWADCCDFSSEAAEAMFLFESTGKPRVLYSEKQSNGLYNGYAVGKHWMDVTAAMWREDIEQGLLLKYELQAKLKKPGLRNSRAYRKLIGPVLSGPNALLSKGWHGESIRSPSP